VPETAVEEALAALRREHTELKPIEGRDKTAAGDIVGLSITGTIGEHEINQPQFAVDLDDPEREPLPGLREVLLGLPLDTKDKQIEITVPDDYKDESLRGRKANLSVTILEARSKDVPELDFEMALKLLSLPRDVGPHPETGKPITASIGRYGPYLAHDGKYAKLASTAEVFEVGMNAAVAKLADAANGGGRRSGSREPLKVMGAHPRTELEIRLMEGRFGPYVTDGTTNATLPKSLAPDQLTLEEAAQLIDERAAKGPPAKKGRARRAPAKKPAKKPATKTKGKK